jgi:hypothetical protein
MLRREVKSHRVWGSFDCRKLYSQEHVTALSTILHALRSRADSVENFVQTFRDSCQNTTFNKVLEKLLV